MSEQAGSNLEQKAGARTSVELLVETGAAIVLPMLVVYISMYRFTSPYSAQTVIDLTSFTNQFFNGIYAYRVLGRDLLIAINDLLFGGRSLFQSYVVLHIISLAAYSIAHLGLMRTFSVSHNRSLQSLLVSLLVIGASMDVITPYDAPFLALFALAVWAIETERFTAAVVLTIAATLTRETALLIPVYALARAIQLATGDFSPRGMWQLVRTAVFRKPWSILLAWLIPYVGLRVFIPSESFLFNNIVLDIDANAVVNVIVILALSVLFLKPYRYTEMRKNLIATSSEYLAWVYLTIIPYGLFCAVFAYLGELRLFVPYFMILIWLNHKAGL